MSIEIIDVGDCVVCDFCNENFTDSEECGGLLFGSYATCPRCVPWLEAKAEQYGEQTFITQRCPPDKQFRHWVLQGLRRGE